MRLFFFFPKTVYIAYLESNICKWMLYQSVHLPMNNCFILHYEVVELLNNWGKLAQPWYSLYLLHNHKSKFLWSDVGDLAWISNLVPDLDALNILMFVVALNLNNGRNNDGFEEFIKKLFYLFHLISSILFKKKKSVPSVIPLVSLWKCHFVTCYLLSFKCTKFVLILCRQSFQ